MSEVLDPQTPSAADPAPESIPDGALDIDVQGQKQKMVPVAALIAERERVRHAERERVAKEYEPLKAKAAERDQLAADLATIQPHIEYLRAHPDVMKKDQPPEIAAISDEAAERYARDWDLYTGTGLDLAKAKRLMAHTQDEMRRVAKEAAAEAVEPAMATTAAQSSKQNFIWAASQRGPQGQPLVTPEVLAREWAKLPPKLTADPQVAQWVLKAAIGEASLTGAAPPPRPEYEPAVSEASGGSRGPGYRISDLERKMARTAGIKETDWTAQAQTYAPDRINILGD